MQPPLPRKPEPKVTTGQASQARPVASRHPQSPADVSLEQTAGASAYFVGTRDADLVRAWADHHGADPATGEATPSGPATVNVNDQGSGLRFNFPGAARFRPVDWDEWLAHFEATGLVFVFEAAQHGADSSLSRFGGAFYRLVSADEWGDQPLATLES